MRLRPRRYWYIAKKYWRMNPFRLWWVLHVWDEVYADLRGRSSVHLLMGDGLWLRMGWPYQERLSRPLEPAEEHEPDERMPGLIDESN